MRLLLITIFLFGIYSRYHLNLGGPIYVPYIFCFFSGAGLFLMNKGRLNARSFYFIIVISIISIIITFLTIITQEIIVRDVIESLVLFIYSIALATILFEELLKFPNDKLSKYFYRITIGILFLCLLDIFTPFHSLSVFVTDLFGGNNQGDFTAEREAAYFFGIRRPFPFTKEPSHVSKFLLIIISGWLILSNKKSYRKFYIIVFLATIIIRSPILLASIVVILYYQISENRARTNIREFSSRVIIVGVLVIVTAFFGYTILEARINSILGGGDPSTFIRFVRPYIILYESLDYSPFFGVGIANNAKLAELYIQNHDLWIDSDLGKGYTVNAIVAPIAYWGIIGAIFHIGIIIKYISNRVSIENLLAAILLMFMISISMGGINSVDYITYILIIVRIFNRENLYY